jgi:transcription termination factor NusB
MKCLERRIKMDILQTRKEIEEILGSYADKRVQGQIDVSVNYTRIMGIDGGLTKWKEDMKKIDKQALDSIMGILDREKKNLNEQWQESYKRVWDALDLIEEEVAQHGVGLIRNTDEIPNPMEIAERINTAINKVLNNYITREEAYELADKTLKEYFGEENELSYVDSEIELRKAFNIKVYNFVNIADEDAPDGTSKDDIYE